MSADDLTAQLQYDGQWHDALLSPRTPVTITRGRAPDQAAPLPSQAVATLDNFAGDYNPQYPLSPLFGLAGRNTPVRHYLGTPHLGDDNFSTSATTSAVAPSLTPAGGGQLICCWATPDPAATITPPGGMTAGSSAATSAATIRGARQTVAAGATGTRTATLSTSQPYVAASVFVNGPAAITTGTIGDTGTTFNLDGSAGDWWVVFSAFSSTTGRPVAPAYPTDTDGGGWLLLADTGDVNTADPQAAWMRMKAWVKRVHRADAAHQIILWGAGSNTVSWATRVPAADVTGDWHVRHHGEAASWTPERTGDFVPGVRGNAWTGLTSAGVLRRLGQGAPPVESALYRQIRGTDGLVAYWPLEDGRDAVRFASGLLGGSTMDILKQGGVDLAADDSLPGSAPLPKTTRNLDVNSTMIANATMSGLVNTATLGFWIQIPDLGAEPTDFGQSVTITIRYSGGDVPAMLIGVFYDPSTGLDSWYAESADATRGITPTTVTHSQQWRWVRASIEQSGSNLRTRLWVDGVSIGDVTNAGVPLGAPTGIEVIADAGSGAPTRKPEFLPVSVGHVAVWSGVVDPADMLDAGAGWPGETAADRFLRLCGENGIPASIVGVIADTPAMGPQRPDTFTNWLAEIERTDAGILSEPRAQLGLVYRTRVSLFNQDPALVLDWADGRMAPLTPVIDDRGIRNDVIARRANGSSARDVQLTGPNNIQPPEIDPEGVGPYPPAEVLVNPASDAQLPDLASWYLNLGTVSESRFSRLTVDLGLDTSLSTAVSRVDIGDLVQVINVPADLALDTVSLLVVGYTETFRPTRRLVTFNGLPATAWQVAVYDSDRYESSGTELGSGVGAFTVLNANPDFETTVAPWTAINGAALSLNRGWLLLTPNGVGTGPEARSENVTGITPGQVLQASAWVRCAVARNIAVSINWRNAGGSIISTSSVTVAVTADTPTFLGVVATAPALTAQAQLAVVEPGAAPADNLLRIDKAKLGTATPLSMVVTSGPMWVTNPARFPFDGFIGGEKVTVTAIAAPTGATQVFTVIRGVNDVQRAWPVGTRFRLARQARYG